MFAQLLELHSLYSLFKIHWMLVCVLLIIFYAKTFMRSNAYTVSPWQKVYFFVAVGLVFMLKATPIDVIGAHYLFSIHVLQLSFIFFIAIPLLLLSIPIDFYRRYIWNHRMRIVFKVMAYPWLTLVMFNGLLSVYLLPSIFDYVHAQPILSVIAQTILFISAFFMWWVIIQPLPEIRNFSYVLRAFYIFLASLALFPIGFFYVVIQEVQLTVYDATHYIIPAAFTNIYDQQAAGGILKISQLASYSVALLLLLFKWATIEEKKEGPVDDENIRYVRGVVVHLDKEKK